MRLAPETPLSSIQGIAQRFIKHLDRLGVRTVGDLLYHFPTRYEDFSTISPIADLEPGELATVQGVINDISVQRTWRKHIIIVEAIIEDNTGNIRAVWFNQPYVASSLRKGRLTNISGKVSVSDGELYLSHPTYELLTARNTKGETRHTARLVPIYPETRGLTSKGLRFLIQPILKNVALPSEWIPETALRDTRLPNLQRALFDIHFPAAIEDATAARKRFSFEDLFLLQLSHLRQKLELAREKAAPIPADIKRIKQILEGLPFKLTFSQKRSLWEIVQDVAKPKPMNRLLQGDVGSGKTVVAAVVSLLAKEAGLQTALMAPTEVLARQHYETFKKLFQKISGARTVSTALVTGSEAKALYENLLEATFKKEKLAEEIKKGRVDVAIGTHALLERPRAFKRLGLVVIDEQHRFGVAQRAKLLQGADDTGATDVSRSRNPRRSAIPHFLSMSATPIPRTLMLTIFGDLDISTITELPSGRKKIATSIVSPAEREEAYELIRKEVAKGRQAFVICPRIENDPSATRASEAALAPSRGNNYAPQPRFSSFAPNPYHLRQPEEIKSVKEEYEKLSQKIFPNLAVAMLHGQMKPKEKEKIMREFHDGKVDVLVSTSVVEVGVDVPNATVMAIEGSDRFGLAQLYQLRGRVGRSEHESHCLLFSESGAKATSARLKAIIEAKNGFELAEQDLKIRGPGEFLGEAQTGIPDIAMEALQDISLIHTSREAAKHILREDPLLARHPLLAERLAKFERATHQE